MATLLIGYDVEGRDSKEEVIITREFLNVMPKIHTNLRAPCTLFICGKTLERSIPYFQKLVDNELFDLQQHTYSHVLLKTVVYEENNDIKVVKGGTLDEIYNEVKKTNRLFIKHLGIKCIGLTGPWCYYRGLSDRPDILEILSRLGIKFTRTYGRNEYDGQPVSMKIQPFWYEPQGFPYILEFPIQDWQDIEYRIKYGWKNIKKYLKHLKSRIDYIVIYNALNICT